MYLITDKGGAITLMMAALFFLGSFIAVLNSLERKGRLLPHSYLDYSITNFLGAVVIALTFGQIGSFKPSSPNFFTQLRQDNGPSVGMALAGGLVLSLGNLSGQYAWPFVGISATTVIGSCFSVVIGSTFNYFLDGRINRAEILFSGAGCFVIAAILGSFLHSANVADTTAKLEQGKGRVMHDMQSESRDVEKAASSREPDEDSAEAAPGSAKFVQQLEERRTVKFHSAGNLFGPGLVILAGLCFALFSPAFNLGTNDQWHTLKAGVPHLVVYTAVFYFSCSAFAFGMITNLWFLYHPQLGSPKSSVSAWLKDSKGRYWAFLAGILCSFGNGFQFMGGQAAGYAAADCV